MRSAAAVALPPGRRRDVEHPVAGLRVEDRDDRLARLVLRRRAAFGDRGQRGEVAGVAQQQRAGHERARLHLGAGRDELGRQRLGRGRASGSRAA